MRSDKDGGNWAKDYAAMTSGWASATYKLDCPPLRPVVKTLIENRDQLASLIYYPAAMAHFAYEAGRLVGTYDSTSDPATREKGGPDFEADWGWPQGVDLLNAFRKADQLPLLEPANL